MRKKHLNRSKSSNRIVAALVLCALLFSISSCSGGHIAKDTQESIGLHLQAQIYQSKELDIAFQYPSNWALDEGEGSVYLAESSKDFPWGLEFFSSSRQEPYYLLYEVAPYTTFVARLTRRERSTSEIAEAIALTYEIGPVKGKLIEPIESYQIDSKDISTLTIQSADLVDYLVIVALEPDQIIVVSANGPIGKIEDMKTVVNFVVESLQTL